MKFGCNTVSSNYYEDAEHPNAHSHELGTTVNTELLYGTRFQDCSHNGKSTECSNYEIAISSKEQCHHLNYRNSRCEIRNCSNRNEFDKGDCENNLLLPCKSPLHIHGDVQNFNKDNFLKSRFVTLNLCQNYDFNNNNDNDSKDNNNKLNCINAKSRREESSNCGARLQAQVKLNNCSHLTESKPKACIAIMQRNPIYYHDTSEASTIAAANAMNDVGIIDTNTLAPPYDANYSAANSYSTTHSNTHSATRLSGLQQQKQRLIFPPPPPAPPPPIFPSSLSRYYSPQHRPHQLQHNNNQHEQAYHCADTLNNANASLISPCKADFSLLEKYSLASTSTTNTSPTQHQHQRVNARAKLKAGGSGAMLSKKSSNSSALEAIFFAAPKTALFALISFLLLILALIFLFLQKTNNDYSDAFYYKNDNNDILYGNYCNLLLSDNKSYSNNNHNKDNKVAMPKEIHVGETVYADLLPRRLVYTELLLERNAQIVLNISVLPHAKLAVYGRQTLEPTPTQYNFQQIVAADRLHLGPTVNTQKIHNKLVKYALVTQFLSSGRWFFGFLNDHNTITPVTIMVSVASNALKNAKVQLEYDSTEKLEDATIRDAEPENECDYDCFGKGICMNGKCDCHPGYSGKYCEETACPVLCSGNGIFTNGICICHEGFKGAECDTIANWCSTADCNSHGNCGADGRCECEVGWHGEFCEERSCQPDPTCSGHGICHNARCYCSSRRWGDSCEFNVSEACSSPLYSPPLHFASNISRQKNDSDICNSSCVHGTCLNNGTQIVCDCKEGWSGKTCSESVAKAEKQPSCVAACEKHGVCHAKRHYRTHHKHIRPQTSTREGIDSSIRSVVLTTSDIESVDDGVCECFPGWGGANCFIAMCGENNCSDGGECRLREGGVWSCVCDEHHFGDNCQFLKESSCNDGVDNDGDGLKDCEDSSECCAHLSCASNPLCLSVASPLNYTTDSASKIFFERFRFLFDATNGVQRYADTKIFNSTKFTILRGRVLSKRGGPLTGVRVSDARNAHYGFTITRGAAHGEHGIFDIAVNGGDTVELLFLRQPYAGVKRSFTVGSNEILNVGDIFLDSSVNANSNSSNSIQSKSCKQKLNKIQQKFEKDNEKYPKITITNHQRQSNTVEKSQLSLAYSILNLTLLDANFPTDLRVVHVNLRVAGHNIVDTLAAHSFLKHAFEWDRRNVYGQFEINEITAKVRIGYEYDGEICERATADGEIFWREFATNFKSLSF